MENNYKSEIVFSTFDMSNRQKVICSDLGDATSVNEVMQQNNFLELTNLKSFYIIHVENPMSQNNQSYDQIVICANDSRYYSGSESLKRSMQDLYEKLGDELFTEETIVKIIKQKSRNYSGKDFYKAILIN